MASKAWKSWLIKRILIGPLVIYVLVCLAVMWIQDSLLFHPSKAKSYQIISDNVIEYKQVFQDHQLQAWLTHPDKAHERLIFYYGGNAEDVFYNLPDFSNRLMSSAILMNYRSYGESTGKPSQDALFEDAVAVYKKVKEQYQPKQVIFMGRSLGSGVACYMAKQVEADALVLITPYDSMINVASEMYPFLPVSWLLNHPFESNKYVKELSTPTLVISAERDEIISKERTQALIDAFAKSPQHIVMERLGHNTLSNTEAYWKALRGFLAKIESPQEKEK